MSRWRKGNILLWNGRKEKVKKMLRDEMELYTKLSGNDGEHTPIGIIGSFLDGYDKGKEDATKWIPCSERLPEENGQYLITVKYKPEADYEDVYAEHGEWTDGQWDMFCFGHCGEVEDIVAWMPLPQPYKGKEELHENK